VATEAAALRLAHELAPRHVPAVLLYDKAASIMVCDFLEGCQDMTSLIKVRGCTRQLVGSTAGSNPASKHATAHCALPSPCTDSMAAQLT
jgi:hypothetical protein